MRATAMLRKVVDDVLDLSRLEIGKSSVQLREVDVVDVTSGVAKMHHLLANEKGIHLECNCELDETQRVLDVDKWLQILTNLLGNAIKYTEEGVVSLVIRNHESKADWIVAEVSDEGKGIPKEHHARIFEPFGILNADNPKEIHRMKEGSTGLGLSISRELARVMDGELTLVPQSVGACFQLSIPSKTWDKPTQLRATEGDHVNQVPDWNAEGMRVLLAEDNDINVLYAKALLDRWKVHVDVAPDGQRALDLMEGGATTPFCWTCKCPTWMASRRFAASVLGSATTRGRCSRCSWSRLLPMSKPVRWHKPREPMAFWPSLLRRMNCLTCSVPYTWRGEKVNESLDSSF